MLGRPAQAISATVEAPARATTRWAAARRCATLAKKGASVQRPLWASTGTKDPAAPDTLYMQALTAPGTINTLPEKTLLAFADHGQVGTMLPVDGGPR